MTKNEYMALPTAKEMMKELQRNPQLRNDKEACAAFNRRAQEEFEANVENRFGKYSSQVHYDFNKKKT